MFKETMEWLSNNPQGKYLLCILGMTFKLLGKSNLRPAKNIDLGDLGDNMPPIRLKTVSHRPRSLL